MYGLEKDKKTLTTIAQQFPVLNISGMRGGWAVDVA
jgi:hypothetical protein